MGLSLFVEVAEGFGDGLGSLGGQDRGFSVQGGHYICRSQFQCRNAGIPQQKIEI